MARSLVALAIVAAFLLVASAVSAQQTAPNAATRIFLQEIANKFPGTLSSWTGDDYCSGWAGVSCASNGEVSLDLSGRDLAGKLPSITPVGNNVRVVSINLSNNNRLYGGLPIIWSGLTKLRNLDLSSTSLSGYIPSGWNGMVSLQTVKIANTYVCGGLPQWAMQSLRSIDLSNNKMAGRLVNSWIALKKLESLNIKGNNFCGCMPITWKGVSVLNDAAPASMKASGCLTALPCWDKDVLYCPVNDAVIPNATTRKPKPNAASGLASSLLVAASIVVVLATMVRV